MLECVCFLFYSFYLPLLPTSSNVVKDGKREREKSCILIGTALSANKTFLLVLLFFCRKVAGKFNLCRCNEYKPRNEIRFDSVRPVLIQNEHTHTISLDLSRVTYVPGRKLTLKSPV